jgi:hypothetical protein
VCVCVCVCVYVCVCVCVCVCACVSAWFEDMCMACMCKCILVYLILQSITRHTQLHTHANKQTNTHTLTQTHTHTVTWHTELRKQVLLLLMSAGCRNLHVREGKQNETLDSITPDCVKMDDIQILWESRREAAEMREQTA